MSFDGMIDYRKAQLQAMEKHPIRNYGKIRKTRRDIQALEEANRDPLTPAITKSQSVAGEVDKNNYRSYGKQVSKLYEMYEAINEYGSEIARGIVDTRTAFIAGEGLSVIAEAGIESPVQKYIDKFLDKNKLHGSNFMTIARIGELEGKVLMVMTPVKKGDEEEWHIKVRPFSWEVNRYNVNVNPGDRDEIVSITYKAKSDMAKEQTIDINRAVFARLGGTERNLNETTNKTHCIITDMENYSRAKYDLRKNTHLFGKIMPVWKTQTMAEAKALNNELQAANFQIGMGYAGTADYFLKEPTGAAADAIIKDILISLRSISLTVGIPIHFLSWPDLMSNRATADNLMEIVTASTKQERLVLEEAFEEVIKKSMDMAIDSGIEDNTIKGEFQVKLPVVSIALLKMIIEVWKPLLDDDIITMLTFLNLLPGINPSKEMALLKKQKEDRAKESPVRNTVLIPDQTPFGEKEEEDTEEAGEEDNQPVN